jgi:hypothetical protein
MSKYSQLRKYCKAKKIKVKEVPASRVKDFAAMNYDAAKAFGFPRIKKNEIIIDRTSKSDRKYRDLKHELVEKNLMERKHLKYWQAHCRALKAEAKPYKGY